MGDFEIILAVDSVVLLAALIYNALTSPTFRDFLRRFGLLKSSRRDFYECGFKPQTQRVIKVSLQFLLICIFFLLYDIELVYLFPFVSGFCFTGTQDMLLMALFFTVLMLSLLVDYERHALI